MRKQTPRLVLLGAITLTMAVTVLPDTGMSKLLLDRDVNDIARERLARNEAREEANLANIDKIAKAQEDHTKLMQALIIKMDEQTNLLKQIQLDIAVMRSRGEQE